MRRLKLNLWNRWNSLKQGEKKKKIFKNFQKNIKFKTKTNSPQGPHLDVMLTSRDSCVHALSRLLFHVKLVWIEAAHVHGRTVRLDGAQWMSPSPIPHRHCVMHVHRDRQQEITVGRKV